MKVGDHSIGHGYRSMQELLKLKERPTAVFLGNFEIILGAVMALNESPYQCPEDLSLIGFDDLIISNLSKPKLVLAVQPLRKMAEEAVSLLLKRIDQNRNGTDKEDGQYEHEILVLPAKIAEGKSIARCG
jgi:LacI family transcriptional regulator